jgi:hypothetical protein
MGGLRVEASEMLVHDLYLSLEHVVLLVGFTVVLCVALKTGYFGVELTFSVLSGANVLDGFVNY